MNVRHVREIVWQCLCGYEIVCLLGCSPLLGVFPWSDSPPPPAGRHRLLRSPGTAALPISCHVCCLSILSFLSLLCICGQTRSLSFQLAGLWCAAKEVTEGLAWVRIARRVSCLIRVTGNTWKTLGWHGAFPTRVGGHHHSLGATFLGSLGDLIVGTC